MGSQPAQVLVETGRAALAAAEWERARACFADALEAGDTPEALDGLGEAGHWLGDYDGAIELKERAFAAYCDADRRVEASAQARILAFLHGAVHGRFAVANGWMERAASLLEGLEESAAHGWMAFERVPLVRDLDERAQLATAAHAIAKRFGDRDLEYSSLALMGEARVQSGRVAEGMRMIDEAMAAVSAGEVRGIAAVGDIYCRLLSACELAIDVSRADQWMSRIGHFWEWSSSRLVSTTCRLHYGGLLMAIGRWDQAERELTSAVKVAESSFRAMGTYAVVRLAELRVRQGRFEEAERLLEGNEWHPVARQAQAAIALARGDPALAQELTQLCLEGENPASPGCAPLLELLVDAQLATGDIAGATEASGSLAELADRTGDDRIRACAAFAAGRVLAAQGDAAAPARLQQALAGFAALELPLEAAHAQLALARALAARSPELAVREARHALAAFERLGAARDADAAGELLRSLGSSGRAWPRHHGELTKRESEVLALLAEGCSNADIASRLFISPRTAEHHVASILGKLGLRSRAEAAAYALRSPPERPVAG